MITFITGMPGDGKTMYAVVQIIKRLVETERFVVTNIKLNRSALHAHVSKLREEREKKSGAEAPTFNLDERLCSISDAEAYEFFRFRSGGHVLDSSPDMKLEDGQRKIPKKEHDEIMLANFKTLRGPDMEHARKPCDYFIDEVHEIFPSREWDKGGRGILFYASKHRHLHDEIFLITQQIDQVEKQLRNLTSETVVVRNHLRRNVGLWKAKAVFKLKFFYGLPTPNAKPFMEPEMKLDLAGAAACYKTTGALGVHDAPETIHNKGVLPYWTMWAAGGAFVLGIIGAFTLLPYAGAYISKRIVAGASTEIQKMSGVASTASSPAAKPAARQSAVERASAAFPVPTAVGGAVATVGVTVDRANGLPAQQTPHPVGVSRSEARVAVSFSDGTILQSGDPDLGGVNGQMVYAFGKWQRIRANVKVRPIIPSVRGEPATAGGVIPLSGWENTDPELAPTPSRPSNRKTVTESQILRNEIRPASVHTVS